MKKSEKFFHKKVQFCPILRTVKITPEQFHSSSTFTFDRYLDEENTECISGIIVGHGRPKRLQLGKQGTIKVQTFFKVGPEHIVAWLCHFGQVAPEYRVIKNSLGINTDVIEFNVVLHHHVPEYLPIYGQKIVTSYIGMPRICNKCFKTGHVRRVCKSEPALWIDYVDFLFSSGQFEPEIFGDWADIIKSRKPLPKS